MSKIIVIGSVNIDNTIYVDSFPRVGETLIGKSKIANLGGKGVNQAIAIVRSGEDCSFLCFVGKDDIGKQIKKEIKIYEINAKIEEVDNLNSGNAFIFVNDKSENEIVVISGANNVNDVSLLEKHQKDIEASEYIVLQNEINPAMNEHIIRKYGKSHKIIYNPAPAKEINKELIPYIYCFVPNEGELLALTQKRSLEEGVKCLLNLGLKNIIVTLGENGSVYASKQERFAVQAFKVNSIDTVAAGDTYIGYLTRGLAQGMDFGNAMVFASKAAALSTTKKGAAPSIPTFDEVSEFE